MLDVHVGRSNIKRTAPHVVILSVIAAIGE